ncbi:MAG TPA: hypothetical protein VLT87_29400 [Thermoanaerobaculia bacterium]|nr:hypothetical protein [Thermoanaerobaculia bacterium]
MAEQHPDSRLLECFLRNELQGAERRVVVRHLLTGCPQCVAVTRRVWSLADGRGPDLFERTLRPGAARGREAGRVRQEEAGEARPDAAEAALAKAWRGFAEQGLGREAAAAVLELALLYKRQGRSSDLSRLAGDEIRPVFYARDMPNHAGAALLVFRRIVETEHASERFLFEIARFLAGPPRSRQPHLSQTS